MILKLNEPYIICTVLPCREEQNDDGSELCKYIGYLESSWFDEHNRFVISFMCYKCGKNSKNNYIKHHRKTFVFRNYQFVSPYNGGEVLISVKDILSDSLIKYCLHKDYVTIYIPHYSNSDLLSLANTVKTYLTKMTNQEIESCKFFTKENLICYIFHKATNSAPF